MFKTSMNFYKIYLMLLGVFLSGVASYDADGACSNSETGLSPKKYETFLEEMKAAVHLLDDPDLCLSKEEYEQVLLMYEQLGSSINQLEFYDSYKECLSLEELQHISKLMKESGSHLWTEEEYCLRQKIEACPEREQGIWEAWLRYQQWIFSWPIPVLVYRLLLIRPRHIGDGVYRFDEKEAGSFYIKFMAAVSLSYLVRSSILDIKDEYSYEEGKDIRGHSDCFKADRGAIYSKILQQNQDTAGLFLPNDAGFGFLPLSALIAVETYLLPAIWSYLYKLRSVCQPLRLM